MEAKKPCWCYFFVCFFVGFFLLLLLLAGRQRHDYATKSQALLWYKWSGQGHNADSIGGGGAYQAAGAVWPQTTRAAVGLL